MRSGHTLPTKYPFVSLCLDIELIVSTTHQEWPSGIKTFPSLPHSGKIMGQRSTQESKVQRDRWDFREGSGRETVSFVPLVSLAAKLGHERFQKPCWDLENGSHVLEWVSQIAMEPEPTLDSQTSLMTDWGDLCMFKPLSLKLKQYIWYLGSMANSLWGFRQDISTLWALVFSCRK